MAARSLILIRQITGCLVGVFCWAVFPPLALAWTDPLSHEERVGRTIYHRGEVEGADAIRAQLNGASEFLPATLFRCAQCHGVRGEGIQEGGLRVPPLTNFALRHERDSLQTGHHREAYTDETLARAITQGLDASGHPLHTSMPRYRMTSAHLAAMVAYLKQIGEEGDTDPGITATTITVGAALPMSGPLAQIGRDVKATLTGMLAQVNQRGGVYGRQVQLVVEDSAGDSAKTATATAHLIEQRQVFALLGSFAPLGDSATSEVLERNQVPLIGPLALSPHVLDPPHPYIFYALPGFELQFRAAIDFLRDRALALTGSAQPRLAVVRAKVSGNLDALHGIRVQASHHTLAVVIEHDYQPGRLDVEALVAQLRHERVDAVVLLGEGEDVLVLGTELDRQGLSPVLLSAVSMAGQRVRAMPSRMMSRVFLVAPLPPPTKEDVESLSALAGQEAISSLGFARMAYIAGSALVEACMRTGRQLSRSALIEALETFRDQDAGPGSTLTFDAHRRMGASRSMILSLTPDPPYLVPVSGWVVPIGGP